MNSINFNQTGGFPLDTDVLAFMQNAYNLFNALGNLAGNLAIISGCELTGNTVADGVVYINGEVLPFKGGAIDTARDNKVIIREERQKRLFENGEEKEVEVTRYATFGNGANTYTWTDFKRAKNLIELSHRVFTADNSIEKRLEKLEERKPLIGEIRQGLFDLNNLEKGWYYCDGQNGTPDLRGYFLRCTSPERAVGTKQLDAQQNITGHFPTISRENWGGLPSGAFGEGGRFSLYLKNGSDDNWGLVGNFDASRQIRTAEEVRPKNYTVHFIIYLGK